ncbi:hypothetical protein JH06_1059 [Blastocystis sp. subtype 4]|uniref:hypothetical protein n=1 Tax=Blastocystis sp. subtype 4 TaxID=944170 RepID=UPI000711442E|nr:hypothetical protein JH06_1059 [Blastocystis sp. subtype 4]KNB45260.1 hypothetical protein JH06_1059 [Blastocystis sp. subtype 4]|eukprot:XP_014528703.1 hypothetical protein JH06_1059 [Blastocystis sp. subtype 4]
MVFEMTNCRPIGSSIIQRQSIPLLSGMKKGAVMMKCVMKWNRLFVLKDKLYIHDLNDISKYTYLPNSNGCSLFVIDEVRKVVVAACKKKLLVYSLGENTAQSLTKEIPLSDTIQCMDFLNSLLFVGLNKEYILVDIVQGRSCKQICSINKGTKVPFCVPIEQEGIGDENENHEQGEMLLANDRKGLFYDFVGSPARGKGQNLDWSSDAVSGIYLCPYLLALVTTGIEIHNSWRYQRIQVYIV